MSTWIDQRGDEYKLIPSEIDRANLCKKWEGPNGEIVTTPYIWPQPHAQANGQKYNNAWPLRFSGEK